MQRMSITLVGLEGLPCRVMGLLGPATLAVQLLRSGTNASNSGNWARTEQFKGLPTGATAATRPANLFSTQADLVHLSSGLPISEDIGSTGTHH